MPRQKFPSALYLLFLAAVSFFVYDGGGGPRDQVQVSYAPVIGIAIAAGIAIPVIYWLWRKRTK